MWVAHVPLVAWLSNLLGAALTAATPIQDRADTRGTVRSLPTLAGPLAELAPLCRSPSTPRSLQLPIVLHPAEALRGKQPEGVKFLNWQYYFYFIMMMEMIREMYSKKTPLLKPVAFFFFNKLTVQIIKCLHVPVTSICFLSTFTPIFLDPPCPTRFSYSGKC